MGGSGGHRGSEGCKWLQILRIFLIRIEARMQQSNANGKSALSGPHDHGIWNGLRHESVRFKYLSGKNGRMGGSGGAHGEGSKRKAFCENNNRCGHKMGAKWDEKWCLKRHMSPGRLYQSSGGNPSTKRGFYKRQDSPAWRVSGGYLRGVWWK